MRQQAIAGATEPQASLLASREDQPIVKARILIVDDEVSATRLLKKNLEQTGAYLVRTENDSSMCLRAAIDFMPDIILLDVIMPGIDGGELAAMIRADARLKATPIVFLTAVATKNDVRKGGGVIGGMPFLAKPAGMPEVLACLREHLYALGECLSPARGG